MMDVSVNYWAVLVAGVSAMVIGFLWYGPLFGKPWMKMMGISGEKITAAMKAKANKAYVVMFLTSLITACVLSHFLVYAGALDIMDAMKVAFWAWLGFAAPVQLGVVLWENKPVKLFILNTLCTLVTLKVMAAILVSW